MRAVNGGICAKFDVSTGQYIAYMQVMGDAAEVDFPRVGSGEIEVETQRRTVAFSHSESFDHWPAPKLILAPDPQDGLDTVSRDKHQYDASAPRYPVAN